MLEFFGLIAFVLVLAAIVKIFTTPWLLITVIVIGVVVFLVIKSNKMEKAEKEKKQAEEEARRKSFYRCPYCGEDYSIWLAPTFRDGGVPDGELRKCASKCQRHFYCSENQTPRTPEHRALLEAEARDVARVASPEFESVIEKVYSAFRETWKTDRHGVGNFIVMERDHAHYHTHKWVWNSETRHEDTVTTKHVPQVSKKGGQFPMQLMSLSVVDHTAKGRLNK